MTPRRSGALQHCCEMSQWKSYSGNNSMSSRIFSCRCRCCFLTWGAVATSLCSCNKDVECDTHYRSAPRRCTSCLCSQSNQQWFYASSCSMHNRKVDDAAAIDILKLFIVKYPEALQHENTNRVIPIHFASGDRGEISSILSCVNWSVSWIWANSWYPRCITSSSHMYE